MSRPGCPGSKDWVCPGVSNSPTTRIPRRRAYLRISCLPRVSGTHQFVKKKNKEGIKKRSTQQSILKHHTQTHQRLKISMEYRDKASSAQLNHYLKPILDYLCNVLLCVHCQLVVKGADLAGESWFIDHNCLWTTSCWGTFWTRMERTGHRRCASGTHWTCSSPSGPGWPSAPTLQCSVWGRFK